VQGIWLHFGASTMKGSYIIRGDAVAEGSFTHAPQLTLFASLAHLRHVRTSAATVMCVALQITVLNAKGIVIKPLSPAPAAASNNQQQQQKQQQQQQQLPSSFSGAHMEVGEQVLAAGLPLNPGASASLPVAVTVGKPPGDAFDAVMLQVGTTVMVRLTL
jgi:hypothetical protein